MGWRGPRINASRIGGRASQAGWCLTSVAVLQHLDLFQGHESAGHHRIENRQEVFDFRFGVDDFDDQRQILRQPQDLGRMQPAGMSKSHRSAQHRRPGEMDIARLEHDRFIKRPALRLRSFSPMKMRKSIASRGRVMTCAPMRRAAKRRTASSAAKRRARPRRRAQRQWRRRSRSTSARDRRRRCGGRGRMS